MKTYEGMEHYIYVSASSEDREPSEQIASWLVKDHFRAYVTPPETEERQDEIIAERIEHCHVFLALISASYLQSADCRDELNYARDLQKQCVLVYLDDSKLPGGMQMRLSRLQALYWIHYEKKEHFFDQLYSAQDIKSCREIPETPEKQKKTEAHSAERQGKRKLFKRILAVIVTAAAAAAVLFGVKKALDMRQRTLAEEQKSKVTVAFYPHENMSVEEYDRRSADLKEFFEILCGDEAEFEIDHNRMLVTIPKSMFGEEDWEEQLNQLLRFYIISPVWSRLCSSEDISQAFRIRPEDIEEIAVKTGNIPGITKEELAEVGIDSEEYTYVELSLTEEVYEWIKERVSDWDGKPEISQIIDLTGFYGSSTAATVFSEEDSCIDFVFENFSITENVPELVAFRMQQFDYTEEELEDAEKFYEPFTYVYDIPVEEWVTESEAFGGNQCEEDKLSDPTVRIRLRGSSNELGEGELDDEKNSLKARLDALEQPYAIGIAEGGMDLVVETATTHMGTDIMRLLVSSYLSLGSEFYDVGSVRAENFSLQENGDGTWEILVDLSNSEWDTEALFNATKAIAEKGGGKMYLHLPDIRGVGTKLASTEVEEAIEDGKISFDALPLLGAEAITEEELWAVNLMKAVLENEMSFYSIYSIQGKGWQIGSVRDADYGQEQLGILPDTSQIENIQKIAGQISDSVTVEENAYWPGEVEFTISLPAGEEFPKEALSLVKELYEACDLDSGCYNQAVFYLRDADQKSYGYINFTADDSDAHAMIGSLKAEANTEYEEELIWIVSEDAFFVDRAKKPLE